MSWERRSRCKGHEGMGFLCICDFNTAKFYKQSGDEGLEFVISTNIALLRKQGLRLLSLVRRIYWPQYYLKGSVSEANLGYSQSFVWRCMWEANYGLQKKLWQYKIPPKICNLI